MSAANDPAPERDDDEAASSALEVLDADALLASLLRELLDGAGSTLAWALRHAPAGDPLPDAWARAEDPSVLVGLAERSRGAGHGEALVRALDRLTKNEHTYPYARECFASAAQDLRWGRAGRAAGWVRDALTHFPGRGTAQPRPERAVALRCAACVVLRAELPALALADL